MSFTALAQSILHDAQILDAYITSNNLPPPSLDASGPPRTAFTTPESNHAHASLLATTHKLSHLARGPAAVWLGSLNGATGDLVTTAAVYRFNIADHVPLDGSPASFEHVAKLSGLALRDFKIVVRYAMTNFIFREPNPGFIAHTAASRALVQSPLIRALMGMSTDEICPGLAKELDVLAKYPGSEEPVESSWALANNANLPMFSYLETHQPKRAETFAFAMEALATMFADSVLLDAYDWAALGPSATIVDVGGGKGYACRTLAKQFPNFNFIVQDLAETANAGRDSCPVELKERIKYVAHDFFTPQPQLQPQEEDAVVGAHVDKASGPDVYFFRAIFHNWPDHYCVQILRNLIPGLKPGARIVIMDPHTPEPLSMTPWQEREVRGSNLRMKVLFNARDRESDEWPGLFEKADKRFRLVRNGWVNREPRNDVGPTLALVEAVWEG